MASRHYDSDLVWSLDGQPVEIDALIAANKGDKAVEEALGKLIEEAHTRGFKAQVAKIGKHTVMVRQGFTATWSQLLDRTSLRSRNPYDAPDALQMMRFEPQYQGGRTYKGLIKDEENAYKETMRLINKGYAATAKAVRDDDTFSRLFLACDAAHALGHCGILEAAKIGNKELALALADHLDKRSDYYKVFGPSAAAYGLAGKMMFPRASEHDEWKDALYAMLDKLPMSSGLRYGKHRSNGAKPSDRVGHTGYYGAPNATLPGGTRYRHTSVSLQQQPDRRTQAGFDAQGEENRKRFSNPKGDGRTPNHHRTGILSEDYPADPYTRDLAQHFDPYDRDGRRVNPTEKSARHSAEGGLEVNAVVEITPALLRKIMGNNKKYSSDVCCFIAERLTESWFFEEEPDASCGKDWVRFLLSPGVFEDKFAEALESKDNPWNHWGPYASWTVSPYNLEQAGYYGDVSPQIIRAVADYFEKHWFTTDREGGGWGLLMEAVEKLGLTDGDDREGNPGKPKKRGMVTYSPYSDDNHVMRVTFKITPALVRDLTGQTVSKKYCRYIADRMSEYWLENDYGAKEELAGLVEMPDDENVEPEMKSDSITIAVKPELLRHVWNGNRRPLHPCTDSDLSRVADYIEKHYFTSDNGGYELVQEAMENAGVWYGKDDTYHLKLLVRQGDVVTGLVGTRNAHGVLGVDHRAAVTSTESRIDYTIAAQGAGGVVPLTQPHQQRTDELRFPASITWIGTVGDYPWVSKQMSWYGEGHFPAIGVQDSFGTLGVLVGFRDEEGNGAAPLIVIPE